MVENKRCTGSVEALDGQVPRLASPQLPAKSRINGTRSALIRRI